MTYTVSTVYIFFWWHIDHMDGFFLSLSYDIILNIPTQVSFFLTGQFSNNDVLCIEKNLLIGRSIGKNICCGILVELICYLSSRLQHQFMRFEQKYNRCLHYQSIDRHLHWVISFDLWKPRKMVLVVFFPCSNRFCSPRIYSYFYS